jgi:hypothetical protein
MEILWRYEKVFTFLKHYFCGSFHSHCLNTLTGIQYWVDQSNLYSDPHDGRLSYPQSSHELRSLQARHTRKNGNEYHKDVDYILTHQRPQQTWSRVENTWSCPQGFEPLNGICQGKLISEPCLLNLCCCHFLGKFKCDFGCEWLLGIHFIKYVATSKWISEYISHIF